jgi:heptosyltransferase-2
MAREYLDLVASLGCADDGEGLELHADPGVTASIRALLRGNGPLVGIAPGAAFGPSKCAFGPSKCWPAERYAAVADTLTARLGARCVVLTGPGEEDTREKVLTAAKSTLVQCDQGAPTIDTLKATIAELDLLVCNDSGPRHVAIAFKVPTVCVMGSTSPRYSEGPYEQGCVLRVDVDCGPCQKPVCETDHRCMTRISSDRVSDTAVQILENAKERP